MKTKIIIIFLALICYTSKLQAQRWLDGLVTVLDKTQKIVMWTEIASVLLSSDDNLENFLHKKVVSNIHSKYTIYNSKWLTTIGEQLVANCDRPYLPEGLSYTFRIIESKDAMTANFAKIPYEILEEISAKITNKITEVNRVVYDISNKPPSTMEWE